MDTYTEIRQAWKPIHLVLRPNLLSIYRDKDETKLRHQITLSDLTAVARQKDPKGKAKHTFALFTPSRNYHLDAKSDKGAQEWVETIRREARIDEGEEDMILTSPGGAKSAYQGFERHRGRPLHDHHAGYSSSEAEQTHPQPRRRAPSTHLHSATGVRRPSHTLDYSGNEAASYSDFSDSAPGGPTARMSNLSLVLTDNTSPTAMASNTIYNASPRQQLPRNLSQMSALNLTEAARPQPRQDEERVVCHGWIYLLKSRSGVRQWKKLWMVLRPKALALYKNEEEYSAVMLVQFPNILNVVEIDPISKSKRFCFQIITEERNYRCCAPDEDAWAKWLGAFKSLCVKRKEIEMQRRATQATLQGQVQTAPQSQSSQQS